jgi:hypothetical protein
MHRYLLLFQLLIACGSSAGRLPAHEHTSGMSAADSMYVWTQVLDSAAWRKSYNFQLFSLRDTLFTFHPDGVWFSPDGRRWSKSGLPNALHNLAFLDYVTFNNAVYALGYFEGNIERYTFRPEIRKTVDFRTWQTVSLESNLPHRFFYHPFVFRNRLWIIGGENAQQTFSDIWTSEDAVTWTKVRENLPFGPRSGSQVVHLRDTLFLLNNDVWKSADGLTWELVTPEILPGNTLFGYAAVVYDGSIWLLGCNRNGLFSSQVLYSSDGKLWREQTAPWLPRGGIAAAVHQNRIFMTGGKYGGTPNHPEFRYDNDLWILKRK